MAKDLEEALLLCVQQKDTLIQVKSVDPYVNDPPQLQLYIFNVDYYILLAPPLGQDMTQGQFLSGV